MTKSLTCWTLVLSLLTVFACFNAARGAAPDTAGDVIRMVPFDQVEMDDGIWAPRTELLVQRTLPHAFANTEPALESLRRCAEYLETGGVTPVPTPHRFRTSDLYKVMEGAALMIKAEPNAEIEALMDRIIAVIARAQQDDGYLYVGHITGSINEDEMGSAPYSYVLHSHELYNVGHLYEAAVAYAQATGKTSLLEVAEKSARHVHKVFFEGDPKYNGGKPVNQAPGHQEIELGLVKLFHQTGDRFYLDLAKRFLDIRGVTFRPSGEGIHSPTYAQQHAPVAEQTEAVGHAVRACYLYAAMAEVDSLAGSDDYGQALDRIWHDIVDTKMHISGGLGAVHGIEGFGPSYVLPNKDTYLETCAAVGNVLFNMRMFLKHGDGAYVDVAEVALYNNCLAGVGLDGTSFFYPNPLEADAWHQPRSAWFGTACCPSNIARLIPQVAGYMYARDNQRLYCVLYGASNAELTIGDVAVRVTQKTQYPLDGNVELHVEPEQAARFELAMRIPTWATQQFVPGKLYQYTNESPQWSVEVNGQQVDVDVVDGFAVVHRQWQPGDTVTLRLPMPVHVNTCIDQVEANRGRVALTRGPLLLCAEGIDNGGSVQRFFFDGLPDTADARVEFVRDGQLAGLPTVSLPAKEIKHDVSDDAQLSLIPYFAWANRDRGSMITWIGTKPNLAKIDLTAPENLKFASARASHTFDGDTVEAVRMKHDPRSSFDRSIRRWTSWPQRGRDQWVEIDLGESQSIKSIGVYFYDDGGGVQVPGDWHVEVPDGDTWQKLAIYNTDQYSTLADNYNTVHPAEPLSTRRVRIVMSPQHDETCVGILSVDIDSRAAK